MKNFYCTFVGIVSLLAVSSALGDVKPAKYLSDVVQEADSVVIEYYSATGKDEVAFTDKLWLERLAGVLERSSYVVRGHCFCISNPQIQLYRKKEKIGTLSGHHGTKLRAYAGQISGDFSVGAQVGKVIVDLAIEKKPANKAPEPTPGSVTPRAAEGISR